MKLLNVQRVDPLYRRECCRSTALGDACVDRFSDGSSILPISTIESFPGLSDGNMRERIFFVQITILETLSSRIRVFRISDECVYREIMV